MTYQGIKKEFPRLALREDEPMKQWTTFHCSSSARMVASPSSIEELKALVEFFHRTGAAWKKDWDIIGNGSNLLVQDGGFGGLLIDLQTEAFSELKMIPSQKPFARIHVGAGLLNGKLLAWARDQELSGCEFVFGIPGTIGGGLRMNAGTPQGWFANIVKKVRWMDLRGQAEVVDVDAGDFEYRNFPAAKEKIILAAEIELEFSTREKIEQAIEVAKKKREGQPLELPNFGSVFKNPLPLFAGKLIEDAGLKGFRRGDAQISPKHANFIVNLGEAKTSDALFLMEYAQREVDRRFHVRMDREVIVIGEASL